MTEHYHPLNSLKGGHWFKLICGASFQHLPAVRNLTLAYTLAGADCIDVAANPAAVAAAKEALQVASELQARTQNRRFGGKGLPWLMVSLNDGEDPHFRKAEFNPADCPADCWRPCEKICPAEAIVFQRAGSGFSGVIDQQCYGCGRCLPICPSQLIYTRSYVSAPRDRTFNLAIRCRRPRNPHASRQRGRFWATLVEHSSLGRSTQGNSN